MNNYSKIIHKIYQEQDHELNTISLIPSENLSSKRATEMYSLRSSNRYFLPSDKSNKKLGREGLEDLHKIIIKELCKTYNSSWAMIDPLSGLNQMDLIMSGLRNDFDKIIILDRFSGGHSSTEPLAKKYAYNIRRLHLNYDTWDIDYLDIEKTIDLWKNEKVLIYIDHTVVLKPLDVRKLLKKIPINWLVYYDISHLQLFYFVGIYKMPKVENLFFGGSTHKSFPGPQKAIILFNNKKIYEILKEEMSYKLSSIHTGSILALLITILEMKKFGNKYCNDILRKTKLFAKELNTKLNIVGPIPSLTYTHQICINVEDVKDATGKLSEIGIITMPMIVPSKNKEGLRLGIQELCRLGITNEDVVDLAKIIVDCITGSLNKKLKKRVSQLAQRYKDLKYVL